MHRCILKTIQFCGLILGRICALISSPQLDFLQYCFVRNFITGLKSERCATFGEGSLLAAGVRLWNSKRIFIGKRVSIQKECLLETIGSGIIEIGDGVSLGECSHITSFEYIQLGHNILTGRYVLISDNSHGKTTLKALKEPPLARPVVGKGKITIGDRVWLGDRVVILGGVTIGEGAVIGANSVVTHDIPAYSVAVGAPARVIKQCKANL